MKNVYEIDGVLIRDSKEGFAARKARILAARAKSDAKKHMQQKAMREEFDSLADLPEDDFEIRTKAARDARIDAAWNGRNNDHEDDGA